jgi:S1-C subfamily serine protease
MAQNDDATETRTKRKQPPSTPSSERPMKQMKPQQQDTHVRQVAFAAASPETEPAPADHVESLHGELDGELDDSLEDLAEDLPAHMVGAAHDTAEWQKTIEKVVRNVVSIHFCQTHSFDTDSAVSSEATGFVVDAEKGYILTNRVRMAGTLPGT